MRALLVLYMTRHHLYCIDQLGKCRSWPDPRLPGMYPRDILYMLLCLLLIGTDPLDMMYILQSLLASRCRRRSWKDTTSSTRRRRSSLHNSPNKSKTSYRLWRNFGTIS